MPLVQVEDFSFRYNGAKIQALQNISFTIEAGELIVLTGRSASGKSTLARALAGFLFQDELSEHSGRVIVNQFDMTHMPLYDANERVAYVQQNPEDQFCTLKVTDEIAFGLENEGFERKEIARRIDDALGIVQGQHLKARDLATLSGGEKQKIAIASMLVMQPDLLILDEPTSNLDPASTCQIFNTLQQIRQTKGLTVMIIEHKLTQLKPLKPRLLVLEEGKRLMFDDISSYENYCSQNEIKLPELQGLKPKEYTPYVLCNNVSVRLGEHLALKEIDLVIHPGEFVALSGQNGSGKTTLLNTLMGFYKPEPGHCHVLNHDLSKTKTSRLVRDVGMVFQNPDHQLFTQSVWDETVLASQNLNLFTDALRQRANTWLKEIGLYHLKDRHPHLLSYGEKRRLNVLSILLHQPSLLLMDEFLIGQDLLNARAWLGFLKDYCHKGHAVLFVTHHIDLARHFCDRLIYLEEGQIIIDCPMKEAVNPLSNHNNFRVNVPIESQSSNA